MGFGIGRVSVNSFGNKVWNTNNNQLNLSNITVVVKL